MAIVVKYDGITGESKIEGFTDHFEVQSFQFGAGRGIGSARGTSTRESSTVSISEIVVTKPTDGTSIDLLTASCEGTLDKKVSIVFVRTGTGGAPGEYLKFELEGCGISGYSMSSGGDRPSESVSFNFDKVSMSYTPIGDDLTGSPNTYGWNLATQKKV